MNTNANQKDDDGSTPLHRAAEGGYYSTCQLLISFKVNINVKSSVGWTALHHASSKGHYDVVKLLLISGASFNER